MLIKQRDDFVCVIIVNYNSGELLKKCLDHLKAQTFRNFNTIVVDNGSSDESITFLRSNQNRFQIILNRRNIGFAAANNLAIKEAEAEWIALLNPDAFPEPKWLLNLMIATRENPGFDFFASKLTGTAYPGVMDGAGDTYHASGLVWRRGHGYKADDYNSVKEEVFSPCAAAALYRRSALLEIGGFDEDFFCYVEDIDLSFRLRLAGYRCLYVPEAVVQHEGSATTGRNSDFTAYHGHRNLVWAYLKNMPMPLFLFYLPLHLLLNVISLIWFTLRGQGRVILRAKWDAVKGIPRMIAKRHEIQAKRSVHWLEIRRVLRHGLSARR